MPKSSKKSQQVTEFRRAVDKYDRLRSSVILTAITWYEAHGYANGPIPPIDHDLAKAIRGLLVVDQKAMSIMHGDAHSSRRRTKRR